LSQCGIVPWGGARERAFSSRSSEAGRAQLQRGYGDAGRDAHPGANRRAPDTDWDGSYSYGSADAHADADTGRYDADSTGGSDTHPDADADTRGNDPNSPGRPDPYPHPDADCDAGRADPDHDAHAYSDAHVIVVRSGTPWGMPPS